MICNQAVLNRDENLIEAARLGDQDALNDLITLYEPEIRKISSKYFLPRSDYEDLIQEGRIAVYKALQSYNPCSNIPFLHFVRMVIKRKVIDSLRSHTRQKHLTFNCALSLHNQIIGMDDSFVNLVIDPDNDPEKKLIELENVVLFTEEIKGKLTAIECQVFEYYFLKGYKQKEIVLLLNIPPKALDNAIQRVKRKCTKYYQEKLLSVS